MGLVPHERQRPKWRGLVVSISPSREATHDWRGNYASDGESRDGSDDVLELHSDVWPSDAINERLTEC
jgi:hypothetical protein